MPGRKAPARFVWPALAVGAAAALFYSSSLPGEVSGEASMGIVSHVLERMPLLRGADIDFMHSLLRMGAHFVAYFALAFCVAHALKYYLRGRPLFWAAWGLASVYGVADEIHQSFVPGRACQVSDMLINAAGAAGGAVLVCLYLKRRPMHKMEGSDSSAANT